MKFVVTIKGLYIVGRKAPRSSQTLGEMAPCEHSERSFGARGRFPPYQLARGDTAADHPSRLIGARHGARRRRRNSTRIPDPFSGEWTAAGVFTRRCGKGAPRFAGRGGEGLLSGSFTIFLIEKQEFTALQDRAAKIRNWWLPFDGLSPFCSRLFPSGQGEGAGWNCLLSP